MSSSNIGTLQVGEIETVVSCLFMVGWYKKQGGQISDLYKIKWEFCHNSASGYS